MVFKFKKKSDKDKSHYISAKESREIARKNARTIRELERRKKRIEEIDKILDEELKLLEEGKLDEVRPFTKWFFGEK